MAYTKHNWTTGETITAANLNHLENGVVAVSANGAIGTANLADSAVTRAKLADAALADIAAEYSSSATYAVGDYVFHSGALYRCISAITTAELFTAAHWVTVALADDVSNVYKKVIDKYGTVYPDNWHNLAADTIGYSLNASGVESENASRYYTDYIPVAENDVIRHYYYSSSFLSVYRRNICCYDNEKNVVSGGSNSAASGAFTVPAGVSYVRITLETNDRTHTVITKNLVPTVYSAYFAPYDVIISDFLTAESEAAIQKIINKSLSPADIQNKYGCALPKAYLKMTQGISEKWYKINMATPPTDFVYVSAGASYTSGENDACTFPNAATVTSDIYFQWKHFDNTLIEIDNQGGDAQYGQGRYIGAENLSDCTLLAIGDSTVDHDVMTQKLLDYFTSKSKTITLLGTLGSGDNKNEGRAGWKATDYLTNKQYGGVVNPFYNPTSETFDFSYYMTNQGYSAPDFVVIQLGINDLYYTYDSAIETTWNAIKTMIDSILAYNNAIKILLNLPTPPNTDQSKMYNIGFLYRNAVIRYNEYAMAQAKALYGVSKVRPTYCHLILDPSTEIRDDVHPTNDGYEKMALEVINQINCWQNGH